MKDDREQFIHQTSGVRYGGMVFQHPPGHPATADRSAAPPADLMVPLEALANNGPNILRLISCGCGFKVVGWDEEINQAVFEDHGCFRPDGPPSPLMGWPASLATMVAVTAVGATIAAIVHGMPW